MARKTLLTEGEIRQFMKLANLAPLGHDRLEEMGTANNTDSDTETQGLDELGMGPAGGLGSALVGQRDDEEDVEIDAEMGDDGAGEEDIEMDMEMGDDDMGDMDADAGGADMVSVDDFLGALEDALEKVTNKPVEVEDDDADAMDDEAPMDDVGDEPAMDMGPPEEEEPMMEATEDEIVAEVARRVAARLQTESDKENMVDALAERIMKRLTSK